MIMYQFMGVANGSAGWSGTWKEHDWKIDDKEVWVRDLWIDLSEQAKNVKMFVSHVNAHQSMTSAEKDSNNRGDRRTCSVDISQSLSPANGLMNKEAMVAGLEIMHGL
uniref:RNase H type-1 domain-containing protein n=1 Tax=Equus caballus TaxID=9796 RepID=A0A9L0SI23_HORSE